MRLHHLFAFVVVAMLALPAWAQTEASFGTALQSTDNMGQEGVQKSYGLGLRFAVDLWDVSLSVKRAELDKVGTPGGTQMTSTVGLRHWLGRSAFIGVGGSRISSDATVWTKNTMWAEGSAGLCFRYGATKSRRPHRDEFVVSYGKEIRTDAVDPNRTRGWTVAWSHDLPVVSSVFLRGSVSTGSWKYLQDGAWRSGSTSRLGMSLIWRAQDL